MTDSPDLPLRRRRRSGRGNGGLSTRAVLLGASAVAAIAVVAGIIGFTIGATAQPASTTSAAPTGVAAPAAPSGTQSAPTDGASPTAGAEDGVRATRIRVERLGIDLEIVEGDGIDAPIGKAAHYPGTAWPGGELNNVYIYGHAQKDMFLTLWEAEIGDEIVLELEDGTERTYVVTEVLPEVPWDALEFLDPTPTEQLTLQTSTSYEPTSPKFVVIAEPRQ